MLQNLVTFLTNDRGRKITNIIFSKTSSITHYWHIGLKKISISKILAQYQNGAENWNQFHHLEERLDILTLRLLDDHFLLIIMEPLFHHDTSDFSKEFSLVKEFLYLTNHNFKEIILEDIQNTLKRILRNFIFDIYLLNLFLKDQFILFDAEQNFYLSAKDLADPQSDFKKIKHFYNIPPSHVDNFIKEITTPYEDKYKIEYFTLMEIVEEAQMYSVTGYKITPLVFQAHSIFENYRFLNQTSIPIAIFDKETRIQFKNTAWIHFFNDYDASDFIKQLNHDCFLKKQNLYDESLMQGKFIKWYFDPIIVAKTQYTLVTAIDSTHNKKEELDTLKTLARLKQSNEDLQRFAHICSHDLKEPLRTISSFSQMLKKKTPEQDEECQKYLDLIIKNTFYMKNLIEDLLKYSEFELHPQNIQEVTLDEIIQDVLLILSSKIKERRALIRLQSHNQEIFSKQIACNKTQLIQVFQNIIDNGIKFNNKKVPIIDIGYIEQENGDRFFIKDNGMGINQEYIGQLFSMFKRLHNKNDYTGSGIGLALCKKIIENHKGRIWLESTVDQGTVVYFELPKTLAKSYKQAS